MDAHFNFSDTQKLRLVHRLNRLQIFHLVTEVCYSRFLDLGYAATGYVKNFSDFHNVKFFYIIKLDNQRLISRVVVMLFKTSFMFCRLITLQVVVG